MNTGVTSDDLAQIDRYLESECVAHSIPGLSAILVHDQEVLWTKAWGVANLEQEIPATVDTQYRICSVTKMFTATLLMQLCEQNRLELEDPVEKYIPELSQLVNVETPITFRHLVSHTAGLPMMPPNIGKFLPKPMDELTYADYGRLHYPAIQDVLESLNETQLLFQPGTRLRYSNVGIALMAHALERITQQDYKTCMTTRILRPLAMDHSIFDVKAASSGSLATGYYAWDEATPQALPHHDLAAFTPTGGLYSSARDMVHFIRLHLGAENDSILTQRTVEQMRQSILATEKARYMDEVSGGGAATGWFLSSAAGMPVVEHGGGDFPFSTFLALAPTPKLGVFIAMNTGSYPRLTAQMAYRMLKLLIPKF